MRTSLYQILEIPGMYDFVQNVLGGKRVFATLQQAVARYLETICYENVLDVGCGTGLAMTWFTGEYYGVGINPHYLKKVLATGPYFFQVGDATALPFQDETFEVVFTLGVLHHLDAEQRPKMLAEIGRVCKSGGHLLILDGLIPSNRLNLIGYALARLDRGRYKMRIEQFQNMLAQAFPADRRISSQVYKVFPGEYVLSVITK